MILFAIALYLVGLFLVFYFWLFVHTDPIRDEVPLWRWLLRKLWRYVKDSVDRAR